ncbi:glycoside hydrolase family protein [Hyphomonas sp.]|uniref:lysozyme n=1 Tax=Hyphomonas sp. TaxID=87 RepID=UPI0035680867
MLTTAALINFLQSDSVESFREKAYDDKQPHLDLNPGDEHLVKGRVTYGSGFTRRPDETPVQLGNTITRQENFDRLHRYIREEVEPVIENLIHIPLWPSAYNAIGSVIFNFGAEEVSKWRLWGRINSGDTPENIALEWMDGTTTSDGEPMLGLHRRRIMEVLMFFGMDPAPGANVTWTNKVMDVLIRLGWDGKMPKPAVVIEPPKPEPVLSAPTLKPEPEPMPRTITLPDEWDKMPAAQQTAWLNTGEFIALGGKVGEPIKAAPLPDAAKAPLTVTKKVIETPKLVDASRPKPMETSQTFKGLSKQDSGRETALIGGGLATVTMAAPAAKELTGFFKAYDMQTILIAGGTFAGILLIIGGWRWWAGRMIAYEGRQKAEQPKV